MVRKSWKRLALAAGLSTAAGCANAPATPAAVASAQSHAANQPVLDILKKKFSWVPASTIRTLTEIEGFNDAQPLAGDAAKDIGPLAKLYIVPIRYDDDDFIDDAWQLTAILEVDPRDPMPQSYRNLGIENNSGPAPSVYCVYLKKRSAGDKWVGALAPVVSLDCSDPEKAKALNVGEETEPGTNKSDFPSVVRFDEDQSGKALIGVNCGDKAWCEIGRSPGGAHRKNPAHDVLPAATKTKKHLIKPWHDEQEVMIPVTGGFERHVRASITPDENLGAYTMLDFTAAEGAVVATIFMETTPTAGKYLAWGLRQGNNKLTLFAQENAAVAGTFDWWATFKNPSGGTNGKRYLVTAKDHSMNPPAVARWKWNPLDEDIWMACDQGCCTVSGGESLVNILGRPPK